MPRTVPGSISAKTGSGPLFFVWLVELHPVGGSALYLSSGKAVTFGGNAYEHDRVKSVDGLTAPYIDYKNLTFGSASIVLRGLSDDGSTALPYVTLEGSINLEGARVFIHLFDVDAGAGVDALFQGYVKTRSYDGAEHTATLEASHLWDCPGIVIPSSTLQQEGFGTLDTNQVKESVIDETTLPLFWSAASVKIRPTIYHTRVRPNVIQVNGIISGCGPTPFDPGDILGATIFDSTPAESITFEHRGLAVDVVPDDTTKYPDGLAHNNVAYFSVKFPITDANKDKLDDVSADAIKMNMAKGRPLIDTGLASSNGVLILKDGLRDPRFGVGMASGEFDDLTAAANLAGTLWQVRQELHEQRPVGDWVQKVLTQIHGFCTFNGRKLQIGIKNPGEGSVATYATRRSGHGGLEICADAVKADFESADTLINQINIKYRLANRHQKPMIAYDSNSQNRLGGTIRTVNPTDFEYDALYVAGQVEISAAMWIREEQNENLRISFETPLVEGLGPVPGDLVTVWSEDIPNNGTNSVFRVLAQTFTTGDIPKVSFQCRVYKASAHANSTAGIGVDLIRSGVDVSSQGRPPDVIPVSLQLIDKVANDVEGMLGHFRAIWTYPAVDLAGDAVNGIFREYPISSVQLFCRFADTESANEWQLVKEIRYPTPQGDFSFDFLKTKTIQVLFVALGLNRSHGPLGWVPDPTKLSALTSNLSATSGVALVGDSGPFGVGEVITEFEIDYVTSKAAGQLNLLTVSGNRFPFYDTQAIAHPAKTQIAQAKLNYPFLTLALNAPHFTYPAVTVFTMFQRKENVQVKIGDVLAANLETYFTYWTTTASFATDGTKLGIATPAWYLTDPLSPPAGINIISGKATKFQIEAETIGGSGVQIWARCAARNGKHDWSNQLSPLGTNKAGDDAVPVPNPPKLITKTKGVRVKNPLPALNVRTLKNIAVVIEARNAAGTILGYLSDSTGAGDWESSAVEFRFDQGLQTAHLYLAKADALALWPAVATLRIRTFLTNDVGTSAASPDAILNVASWTAELSDTGPPNNGVALTIKRARLKAVGKLLVDFDLPSVQMNSFDHLVLILHDNNATGAGRRFYDPYASAWVALYPDGRTELSYGQGGIPGIPIRPAEIFVGGRTQFYCVIGVYNRFNGSSVVYSADLPAAGVGLVTQAASEVDGVNQDTTVPDPSALTPIWSQSGKHGHYTLPLPATLVNTHTRTEIVIFATTAGGTILGYLARNSGGAYVFSSTEYLFDIGKSGVFDLNLKKVDLLTLFPTIVLLKAYYYVSNANGRSVNHSVTLVLNYVDLVDYLSARNAVNVIEVGETMLSGTNIVRNGEFNKNDPVTTTNAKFWGRWQPAQGILKTNNILGIRQGSPGVQFSLSEHCCTISDGAFFLVQDLGKVLLPGDSYVLQGIVKGSPSGFAPQLRAWLVKNNTCSTVADLDANNLLDNILTFPLSSLPGGGVSSTVYKNWGASDHCQLTANLNDGTGIAASIWLVIGVPAGFTSPNLLKLDRIRFAVGRQPMTYTDNPLDIIGVEDNGGTGFLPANVGDFSDSLYSPSGGQGGFPFGGGVGGGFA